MQSAKETTAYLGLGSNVGDRRSNLEKAVEYLKKVPVTRVLRESPIYESKPWGKEDQADYLNMVVEVGTRLPAHTLLRHCKRIEAEMGRTTRDERWGPRPIDLDILLFGSRPLRTASLQVPHLRMWERHFVLRPLADLKPDLRSPDGTPITELLQREKIAAQAVWPYVGPGNGQAGKGEDGSEID